MEKVYLFAEMLEFKRQYLSYNDIISTDLFPIYRSFKSDTELATYLQEKTLKTREGFYTSDNKVIKGRQGYSSVFYYDKEEMDRHFEANGGASGFTGNVYSDWLYFDLESHVNSKDLAEKVNPFLNYLKENKIMYLLFFSGNKGMHLYIPMKYLKHSEELEGKAHIICKAFSKQLSELFPTLGEVIDPQVYAPNTVLRMPFTINPKSGMLKTILNYDNNSFSRMTNNIEAFKRILVRMYQPEHEDITPHWTLKDYLSNNEIPEEVKFDIYFPSPYGEKACIWKLFNTKLTKGENRHSYAIRLMSFLKNDKEFPNSWVWAILQVWNKDCLADPLDDKELAHIFRGVDTYNYNLCNDQTMNKFCVMNNTCQFWKVKNTVDKGVTMIDALKQARDDAMDTSPRYNMNKIFEDMNIEVRPNRGQIFSIIAGSKVGKSLISLNIALKSKIPTAIFSYEMSKLTILEQLGKMLNLDPLNELDSKQFVEETKHIFIIDEGRVALQNVPTEVQKIEMRFKIKVSFVILDYLQIVPVYNINKPGWFEDNDIRSISITAAILPEMVKKHKWVCFLPTQPTKGVEGGGSTVLLPSSGRGGQTILAMCDFVMTAWRPFKNNDPTSEEDNDNVISLWVGANRHGRELKILNYEYLGDRRLIGKKITREIQQKAPVGEE